MTETGRKPHNYWDEMTPAQREELARMEAMAAKTKEIEDIGKAQRDFDPNRLDRFKLANNDGNGNGNGDASAWVKAKQRQLDDEEEDTELASQRLTKNDIDFMFEVMMKESKYDGLSIRQTVHGLNSAFTRLPIGHVSTSKESGAGKSYIINHIADFYPNKYQIRLAAVSDKALFHLDGPMIVIKDEETGEFELLEDILNQMEDDKEVCEENLKIQQELRKEGKPYDKDVIKEMKQRIKEIDSEEKEVEKSAQKLIDFDNKILIVQDTPNPQFFNLLMTILSQDTTKDQEYAFTDKSSNGKLFANKNRIRGMPVIMTTQVLDDTDNSRFEEKIRRFIHISPNTSAQKIREANRITALRLGYLPSEYDKLVVSRDDIAKAKRIVRIVIAKLKQHKKYLGPKESGVRVPFALTLAESLPVEEGEVWKMTVEERTMKYLAMVTKLNMDCRPTLVNRQTRAFYPISTFEDLKETMALMERGGSKVRPYLQQWYDEVFLKCFEELGNDPKRYETNLGFMSSESVVGLTTADLSKVTLENPDAIRKRYLDPLINLGLIQKTPSQKDNRVNIYYPPTSGTGEAEAPDSNSNNTSDDKRIKVKDATLYPDTNLIVESLRTVIEYDDEDPSKNNSNFGYEILDEDGQPIALERLAERYFSNPDEYFERAY
jgi:hypothetical protein